VTCFTPERGAATPCSVAPGTRSDACVGTHHAGEVIQIRLRRVQVPAGRLDGLIHHARREVRTAALGSCRVAVLGSPPISSPRHDDGTTSRAARHPPCAYIMKPESYPRDGKLWCAGPLRGSHSFPLSPLLRGEGHGGAVLPARGEGQQQILRKHPPLMSWRSHAPHEHLLPVKNGEKGQAVRGMSALPTPLTRPRR
jgi:hypothetical protein